MLLEEKKAHKNRAFCMWIVRSHWYMLHYEEQPQPPVFNTVEPRSNEVSSDTTFFIFYVHCKHMFV